MMSKRGSGSNCFNNEILQSIYNDYEKCVWCGLNGADCFDHVISRKNKYTDSILNAAPTHNQKCNIAKHGEMHTRENQEMMIKTNAIRLNKEKYRLIQVDLDFISEYNLTEIIKDIL